jgi:hypothetical protein
MNIISHFDTKCQYYKLLYYVLIFADTLGTLEKRMTTIGDVAEIMISGEWIRIRQQGGQGLYQCRDALHEVVSQITHDNRVAIVELNRLNPNLKLSQVAELKVLFLRETIKRWDPAK